ncbi:MAG: glycosyltransferase N-terminal domain-containing protein [Fulvivirga sp.]
MALLLYSLFIRIYHFGIWVASVVNPKAQLFLKGRKRLIENIEAGFKPDAPVAWFHCASLGEFEQGRPVIEAFKERFPHYKIVLTFFSPSGYEVRKNYSEADLVCYLPLDKKGNARRFVNAINPSVVFFVKYEFWHFYSRELKKRNIPLLSIATILRPGQVYFKSYGAFYKNILHRFTHFFVQDQNTKSLLESIDITNCEVSGDTRFDRVAKIYESPSDLPLVEKFTSGEQIMVVGSAWSEDIDVLTSFINGSTMKFIIAPHEIEERFMQSMKKDFMRKTIRYSELSDDGVNPADFEVLIIDNVGMLSTLYKYGHYAYVGGGFGRGLHNILEPATFGLPIFFGDQNYEKFREAIDLIKLGGAVAIADYDALRVQFRSFSDYKTYEIASQINADYVKNNTGATKRIVDYCEALLK